MLTAQEMSNLTDDELQSVLKKRFYRSLAKQIAVRVAIGVAVHFATEAIIKKIADSEHKQDSK